MPKPMLASAMQLERELGIRHGTIAAAVKQKVVVPIWLPGRKRPKYDRRQVYKAFGVNYEIF